MRALSRFPIYVGLAIVQLTACSPDEFATAPRDPGPMAPGFDVQASVMTVTNTNDNGAGSLREAITNAVDGTTIQFDASLAGQTIEVDSELVIADKEIVIEGPAADGITIDGRGASLVLHVSGSSADVTLRNLTVANGGNGGIRYDGELTLEYSTVSGNNGSAGGGISAALDAVRLTLVNSTVSGNTAISSGGGIRVIRGDLILINSTVVNNAALSAGQGGGIYIIGNPPYDSLIVKNSVIANNSASVNPNCRIVGAFVALSGKNVFGDADCGSGSAVIIGDPLLAPLADNGGPSATHEPLRDSPVIDGATDCTVTDDQRHVERPLGAACDIGAVEFDDYVVVSAVIDGSGTVKPKTGTALVSGSIACPEPLTLQIKVSLSQNQKVRRVSSVVQGSSSFTIECDGTYFWSAAIAASGGAFVTGSASATLQVVNPPNWVAAAPVTRAVQLYWAHR